MKIVLEALRKVFYHPIYILIASLFSIVMFGFMLLFPVGRFDPGALYFQITELDTLSLVSFALFSLLAGALVAMEVFLIKHVGEAKGTNVGRGMVAVFFSVVGGIFGSGVCAVCLLLVLSLVGLPATALGALLAYRIEILFGSILIMLVAFYFAAKAIKMHKVNACSVCNLPKLR